VALNSYPKNVSTFWGQFFTGEMLDFRLLVAAVASALCLQRILALPVPYLRTTAL